MPYLNPLTIKHNMYTQKTYKQYACLSCRAHNYTETTWQRPLHPCTAAPLPSCQNPIPPIPPPPGHASRIFLRICEGGGVQIAKEARVGGMDAAPCRDEGRLVRVFQKDLPRAHDILGK